PKAAPSGNRSHWRHWPLRNGICSTIISITATDKHNPGSTAGYFRQARMMIVVWPSGNDLAFE
ncbi:MAG: hypothetical protein ACTH8A_08365, partial [Serratia proteamaculans]